jgi:hypothetical protein
MSGTVIQFRGRRDDGDERTATWILALNQTFSVVANVPFRLRFTLANKGEVYGFHPQIQYSYNDGDWTNVTGTSQDCTASSSAFVNDETPTTVQLQLAGDYTQTFATGYIDTTDGVIATDVVLFTNQYSELEYCLVVPGSAYASETTLSFRLAGLMIQTSVVPEVALSALRTIQTLPAHAHISPVILFVDPGAFQGNMFQV